MAGEALQEVFAAFGFNFDATKLTALQGRVQQATNGIRQLGQAMMGGVIVAGIARFVDGTRALGDEIDQTSQRLGLTARGLQELRYAAELGGVEVRDMDAALRNVQRRAVDAASGGGGAAAAFRRLGVDVRDASGQFKTNDQLLLESGVALSRLGNQTERAALAQRIFGRSGDALLPMFANGEEGVRRFREEFQALGGGASDEMVRASAELSDQFSRFRIVMLSLRSQLAMAFLPVIDKVTQGLIKLGSWIGRLTRHSHVFQVALGVLGVVATVAAVKFAVAWAAALWPLALGAAAIGLIVLAIDDVIVTLEGGNSMIQAFIDELFGVGTTQAVLTDLRVAWNAIVEDVTAAWEAVMGFGEAVADTWRLVTTGSAESADERHDRETREIQAEVWRRARERAAQGQQEDPGGRRAGRTTAATGRAAGRQATQTARRQPAATSGRGAVRQPAVARAPETVRVPTGRQVTVSAPANVQVNITAQGADANRVAEIAARRVGRELERQRRQTVAALVPAAAAGSGDDE